MNDSDVRFYYIRDKQNRPTWTVAVRVHGDKVDRAVAMCSPKDNPNKKLGRTIAVGRLRAMVERGTNYAAYTSRLSGVCVIGGNPNDRERKMFRIGEQS